MQAVDNGLYRYEQVERRIHEMIDAGDYRPGERLPSLRGLSRSMGVSLATAGQAYAELERKGLVEARERSGFFVREGVRRLPAPVADTAAPTLPAMVNRGTLIRSVLEGMGRDGLLQLGVAQTCPDLLPAKALSRCLGRVAREQPLTCIEYESIRGNMELRRQIATRIMDAGMGVRPEEVLVTAGAMEGLYLSLRALTRPGDTVVIQSPTYYCFLQLLENLGLKTVEIPSCPESGVDPADLHAAVNTYDVRACILTPNFNNPDGALMPEEAKREIVDILARREIPLVEDDVYGELAFGPKRPGSCKRHDRKGLVIYCSSFSKTLAPGWRVGWIVPGRFLDRALDAKSTTNVNVATPQQLALAEYLGGGGYERHLKRLRRILEGQMRAMQASIARHFPQDTRMTAPRGGTELWLELPRGVDSIRYYMEARNRRIGVCPGVIFSTQDRYGNFIRMNCGNPFTPELERGVAVLGALAGELGTEPDGGAGRP